MNKNSNMMRKDAADIFQSALRAVDPFEAVCKHVEIKNDILIIGKHQLCLKDYRNIFVVGAGKASASMANAMEYILADYITNGIVLVKDGYGLSLKRISVLEAGHPFPDGRGIKGTEKILSMVEKAGKQDLVICLISGGGSSLLIAPSEGISLKNKQDTTKQMLSCGANIHDINIVRKHLSQVKGGKLACMAYPATVASLILSDVVGDHLGSIASGPTVPDVSTFMDAQQILKENNIWDHIPSSVQHHIRKGTQGTINDTPKQDHLAFHNGTNVLVGTNLQALTAAANQASRLGYQPLILSSSVEGEAREAAKFFAAVAREVTGSKNPIPPPACIICGGETTVTIKGKGKGGRNQECALAFALSIDGVQDVVILCAGTDGTDGPTDAAGAIADGDTVARSIIKGLDAKEYLIQNNSYSFFKIMDDLVFTGPTRTNVMDVYIILVGSNR